MMKHLCNLINQDHSALFLAPRQNLKEDHRFEGPESFSTLAEMARLFRQQVHSVPFGFAVIWRCGKPFLKPNFSGSLDSACSCLSCLDSIKIYGRAINPEKKD